LVDSGERFGSLSSSAASSRVGLVLGDIDKDGDPDAVMPNQKSATSQDDAYDVFMNDGTGNFSALTTGGGKFDSDDSKAVALGDVNGDTYLDAVVAVNGGGNKLYLSNGMVGSVFGGFTRHTSFGGGKGFPQDVALGDVNGDSRLDVVVASSGNGNNGREKVFFNIGSGTFFNNDADQLFGGSNSSAVEIGDLSMDGKLDVVVANIDGPNAVYLNTGSGFGAASQTFEPAYSTALALVDLNLDTYLDVVVTNQNAPNSIWLNNGSGTLAQAQ
jgi:hypothetical protein